MIGCEVLGEAAEPAKADLVSRLQDPEALVQLHAARALAGIGEIEKALPVTRNFLETPPFQLQAVLAIDECNLLKINHSLRSVFNSTTYSYPKRVIAKLMKPQSK